MTPKTDSTFYENEILSEELDYTIVDQPQPVRFADAYRTASSRILRVSAAFAVTSAIMFGPVGASAPADYAGHHQNRTVLVKLKKLSPVASEPVSRVDVTNSHQRAAERFRRIFRAVPLSETEKLPDPDFGI